MNGSYRTGTPSPNESRTGPGANVSDDLTCPLLPRHFRCSSLIVFGLLLIVFTVDSVLRCYTLQSLVGHSDLDLDNEIRVVPQLLDVINEPIDLNLCHVGKRPTHTRFRPRCSKCHNLNLK